MADDTDYAPELLDFHPCDNPAGMEYYDLFCLADSQQEKLNKLKAEVVRSNQKFFYDHPEIRGILQVIIRKLLKERPTHHIPEFLSKFFKNEEETIKHRVDEYMVKMTNRPPFAKLALSERALLRTSRGSENESGVHVCFRGDYSCMIAALVDEMVEKAEIIVEGGIFKPHEIRWKDVITSTPKKKVPQSIVDVEDEFDFDLDLDSMPDFQEWSITEMSQNDDYF